MRAVLVPASPPCRIVTVRGSFPSGSSRSVWASLLRALDEAAEAEASDGVGAGWSVWWREPRVLTGSWVDLHIGVDARPNMGATIDGLVHALAAAGFDTRVGGRASTPKGLRPFHALLRGVRVGALAGDYPVAFRLFAAHDGPPRVVPNRPAPRSMRCRACGTVAPPMPVLAGYPTRDAELAAALGEIVLTGCLVPTPDAVCRACGSAVPLRGSRRR